MNRTFWTVLAVAALLATSWWLGGAAEASNQVAERLDMQCTRCHDKPGSRLLTDEGKYWELMRTFDGLDEVNEAFGSCTECHVKKPGSLKLTDNGRKFARLVGDMEGLKGFLEAEHPMPPEEEEETPDEEPE